MFEQHVPRAREQTDVGDRMIGVLLGAENPGQVHVSRRDSRAAFGRLENPWVDYQALRLLIVQ